MNGLYCLNSRDACEKGKVLGLPVKSRIDIKILLLTYKSLNGLSLPYLQDLIVPYIPKRTLRSTSAGLVVVPTIHKSRLEDESSAIRQL